MSLDGYEIRSPVDPTGERETIEAPFLQINPYAHPSFPDAMTTEHSITFAGPSNVSQLSNLPPIPPKNDTSIIKNQNHNLPPTPLTTSENTSEPVCAICARNVAIYTCPRCSTRTCSLICSTSHKNAGEGCSGIRNKAAYIPMNQYGYMALVDDYTFLEDVGRKVGEWGKEIVQGGYTASSTRGGNGGARGRGRGRGRGGRGGRGGVVLGHVPQSKRDIWKMELDFLDIEMELLPSFIQSAPSLFSSKGPFASRTFKSCIRTANGSISCNIFTIAHRGMMARCSVHAGNIV